MQTLGHASEIFTDYCFYHGITCIERKFALKTLECQETPYSEQAVYQK